MPNLFSIQSLPFPRLVPNQGYSSQSAFLIWKRKIWISYLYERKFELHYARLQLKYCNTKKHFLLYVFGAILNQRLVRIDVAHLSYRNNFDIDHIIFFVLLSFQGFYTHWNVQCTKYYHKYTLMF